MTGTRTFESELKRLFELETIMKNPLYCGNMMLAEIGEKTRVKISFGCTGMIPDDSCLIFGNRYDAVAVSIINKNEGVVDSNMFCFKDICSSYPYFVNSESGEVVWMREIAGDFMKISRKIIAYIKMFAEFSEKETVEPKENIKEKELVEQKSIEQKLINQEVPEVGDVLWYVDFDENTVRRCIVLGFNYKGIIPVMALSFYKNTTTYFAISAYGKLFFLDKNEALKVLKEKI